MIPDKMTIDLVVLSPFMGDNITKNLNGTLVVIIDRSGGGDGHTKSCITNIIKGIQM